jgi:hypothetical protein
MFDRFTRRERIKTGFWDRKGFLSVIGDFFGCSLRFLFFRVVFGGFASRCSTGILLRSVVRLLRGDWARNPPASDARCKYSAQRFFVVRPALLAHTQLVQLPSVTTCSLQASFSPYCVLDKTRPLQVDTSPLLASARSRCWRACESECRNWFTQDYSSEQPPRLSRCQHPMRCPFLRRRPTTSLGPPRNQKRRPAPQLPSKPVVG